MMMSKSSAIESTIFTGTTDSDSELVIRARKGDNWAEEALYRKHVHAVTSLASKLLRNHAEAEDVVQDTFIQAFRDLNQLQTPSKVHAWLMSIVVRRSQARFRKKSWRHLIFPGAGESETERLEDQVHVEASQETMTEIRLLDAAFDQMKLSQRTPWILRYLEGYQLGEIADITGVSLATAKRRIAAAQDVLDRYVAQKGGHHD